MTEAFKNKASKLNNKILLCLTENMYICDLFFNEIYCWEAWTKISTGKYIHLWCDFV